MNKSLLSIVAASVIFAAGGIASAQTTNTTTNTTTSWTTDQGTTIREYSTTQKYGSFNDPAMKPTVGTVIPGTITVYPLPETLKVPSSETYSYGIINNNPVVIERTTRKIVHSWE